MLEDDKFIDARDSHGKEARLTLNEEDWLCWIMTKDCWNLVAFTIVSWNGH